MSDPIRIPEGVFVNADGEVHMRLGSRRGWRDRLPSFARVLRALSVLMAITAAGHYAAGEPLFAIYCIAFAIWLKPTGGSDE